MPGPVVFHRRSAYVVAVVVGLDMIAERWLAFCKTKPASELREVLVVNASSDIESESDGDTLSANDDFDDSWQET